MILSRCCNGILLIVLSIISIALSSDLIPHNEIITKYLNPFNFVLYFELGKYARVRNLINSSNITSILGSLIVLILIGVFWPSFEPSYFSVLCIPFVISAFIFLDSLLRIRSLKFLVPIGKYSFVIYLCHIQIAGIINGRFHGWTEFIKVPVAFLITCVLVFSIVKILQKTHRNGKLIGWLGYR